MELLRRHIRKIVYALSAAIGLGVYFYVGQTVVSPTLREIRLTEIFGLISIALIYLALLASPLYVAFPRFPFRAYYILARRALGVSGFFFALVHALLAFFRLLGGFPGLGFLSSRYLMDMTFAAIALLILSVMALTSNKYSKILLGRGWKRIHRFVYLAGFLIIIHTLTLGAHFVDISGAIPQIFFYALLLLLILEALRLDKAWQKRFGDPAQFGPMFVIAIFMLTLLGSLYVIPHGSGPSLGIHSQHAQQPQPGNSSASSVRYTVSMTTQGQPVPNRDTILSFKIYNADTGAQETEFSEVYTKLMHLVIVDNQLDYYDHVHPELTNGQFRVTVKFPQADLYHLYLNFQPTGGQEQQFALTLPVGDYTLEAASQIPDTDLSKTVDGYTITLTNTGKFLAQDLSIGFQPIDFRIVDAKTGQAVTTLKPYLGAFGHLVMINEQTYEYVHIHPSNPADSPGATAGPAISFVPHALFSPLKAGTYRVFLQLNPNGRVVLADFTIKVE